MELQQLLSVATAYGANIIMADEKLGAKEVSLIAYDSRKVQPNSIFVAIPGGTYDGHNFIADALAKGAVALVVEQIPADIASDIIIIQTKDSRRMLGRLVAAYYGHPEQELRMIGVTGTNGKTTTTHLIKFLLENSGIKTGLIGTIHNLAGQKVLPPDLTTPESLELFSMLAIMRAEDCRAVVMEVSAHGLEQGRSDACDFSAAIFTNLSQDHLDYFGSLEKYLASKTLLFSQLNYTPHSPKYGVVNIDDPTSISFVEACQAPLWTYGSDAAATLRLINYQSTVGGSVFTVHYEGQDYQITTPLIGKFNIYNALAALCCLLAEGLPFEQLIKSLAKVPQVPGRFEIVDCGQNFTAVVDYAHTPDGLENVLNAARQLEPKRLISVFGCGGNRDSGKRPIMGRIGAQLSDVAIITTDNPRHEDPLLIIDEVKQGIEEIGLKNYLVEADRAKAIAMALNMAEAGDLVLIAGKGHEDYQILGSEKIYFDDREQVRAHLA